MKTAVTQASACTARELTNSPILNLSPVNFTRGTTAKLSCMLRITWLRIRSLRCRCAVKRGHDHGRDDGQHAGNQAAQPGLNRMCRKPSMMIWPASVPVSVEFCPVASSAKAKMVLAAVTPSEGVRSW